jgi:predicted metal-dependent hydrolase
MARPKNKNVVSRRSYPAARLARQHPVDAEPNRLLKVWRRVLERRLRTRLRAKVAIEIHDNTHTMLTFQRQRAKFRLRLHHMFLAAPDDVLQALADFVRQGDTEASVRLDKFIERNKAYIRRVSPAQMRKRLRLDPAGRHHDLARIFERLNERYFASRISAAITYGPAPRVKGPRKSIKMGSYSADSKVIRIHPALDQPVVPRYFVEWIVFHEMLHQVHDIRVKNGRREFHSKEFLADEAMYEDYDEAKSWERRHLDALLTY